MTDAFMISGAILVAAAIVSLPLSRIANYLNDLVKTHYNPDGTRRDR